MRILILLLFLVSVSYSQPPIEPGVSQELARWRAARYSDVRYQLNLTLVKMSPVLKGTMEIRVVVRDGAILLDWRKIKGHEEKSTISNVSINGRVLSPALRRHDSRDPGSERNESTPPEGGTQNVTQNAFEESNEHLIFRDGVIVGENVIKLDFTSPILASGSAITRYIDKEDGSEYIYSLFVPSDASTAFPVFDQPDLKAKFTLSMNTPVSWKVVANSRIEKPSRYDLPECFNCGEDRNIDLYWETKPISTYVFAFAAGPWSQVSAPPTVASGSVLSVPPAVAGGSQSGGPKNPPATAGGTDLSFSVFVRKSQLAKFQPHAAEVFRLNREGIKFLEEYFDYKFPFPKYDIVLIPEFPFGGMEHAGATFLRESSVIFPSEPTANDHISRANVIFHEAAHQWFGDTVTMKWFDDLWLKEGFAEFMAYKTLERVMPQYNAWKAFYERNKPLAYATDSTRGTTPIYQEIKNLNSAKSAYGNIVYRKAPSFLRQAEFYLGPDKFQTAVRAFLKKHDYANAEWKELVNEFQTVGGEYAGFLASNWVIQRGMPKFTFGSQAAGKYAGSENSAFLEQSNALGESGTWWTEFNLLALTRNERTGNYERRVVRVGTVPYRSTRGLIFWNDSDRKKGIKQPDVVLPNHEDYGYGIFLLDYKGRDYVLQNIQNEKDDFLRSMMWGALWDSVREAELDPKEYVELAIKVLSPALRRPDSIIPSAARTERKPPEGGTLNEDESTTAAILGRVSTAMTYYIDAKRRDEIASRLETILIEKMLTAPILGQRITYYRALLNIVSSENGRRVLKEMLRQQSVPPAVAGGSPQPNADGGMRNSDLNPKSKIQNPKWPEIPLKTKDRFDIVTKLASLGDPDAEALLKELEKTETTDDAKRYAYAARAAFPTKETKEKYWNDFTSGKDISESWIEAAFGPFNSVRHADLTLPYLERALKELPNHKRNRKIFFVNGWLAAFIGGQKWEQALAIVNKFLADNPNLDRDLRLKILENVDVIERAVKIRGRFATR